jgi:glycosyltransferase involved in cell wall biosynthesis
MGDLPVSSPRVTLDGKFFRSGAEKFYLKGVTYGPFAPGDRGDPFPVPEQVRRDFWQIRELGANLLRVYYVPPVWFLDLADEHELKVLIDVPWSKHLCFLDSENSRAQAREAVRTAVAACRGHPAVFAYSVVNEIPAEIVRWSGPVPITGFIEELVGVAKSVDPECLCTFTSFPPTEFLRPQNIDFVCFNLYLHQQKAYESYLARLQMLADAKPLLLGEFGIDSIREQESKKCEVLSWQIESAFRGGLAGTVVFSYTDDWFRGGHQIEDWAFGLTTRDRTPKDSFRAVQRVYRDAPYFPLARYPRVSVVVASYNGGRTLPACLESLRRLRYPDYEVILVDDGSTDATPEIAKAHPAVRYLRQDNHGLSVARNTGIAAATGEIVAFTDSDCRADEDWLYYLVSSLLNEGFAGVGGHNFLPPEDSLVAAAVLVSPGGPTHVMLSDREAEHIPGCNMAFFKWALEDVGGFDPVFRKAGDDVDLCWRLQERGYRIGFNAAGFVWHYRRSTVRDYLKQQRGYGEAEALLAHKHPEYFNVVGGGIWRGRIYAASRYGLTLRRPVIYHGLFGSGFFQRLYAPEPAFMMMLWTSLEYHALVTLPLAVLAVSFEMLWPLALTSPLVSMGVCVAAAAQAELPRNKRRFWSRPLVALLFFLQPIVRGWARYRWRLTVHSSRPTTFKRIEGTRAVTDPESLEESGYWSSDGADRFGFLGALLAKLEEEGWQHKTDTGWSDFDVEIFGSGWNRLRLATVSEELGSGKRVLRCRLRANWSLLAKTVFASALGVELIVVGLFARNQPWIWMLPLSLTGIGWYFDHQKRQLQQLVGALLDVVAKDLGWVKLAAEAGAPAEKT